MKNKKTLRIFTALLAVIMCLGGFSVTAHAQVTAESEDATPPETTITTTPEKPLTPGGNATLVDDFGGNKQLITVTTKSGNYFYILVDRDAEGENTVHFLNQVDEADLMVLMEDENGTATTTPAVCNCTNKCETGKVNLNCPACKTDTSGCTGKENATIEPEPDDTPEPEKKSNPAGPLLVVLLFAGLGGGAFYYLKVLKPKQAVKGNTDFDELEFDEYEDEPEETPEESEDNLEDIL